MKNALSYAIVFAFIASLSLNACERFKEAKKNHKKTIALIIAFRDYQPQEYNHTKQVLSQAGFSVITVSTKAGTARATDKSTTPIDKTIYTLKDNDYDAIFIIGGPGAHTELDTEAVYAIMQTAHNAHKIIGAICYSPRILAKAGLLKDKKATGWNDDNELKKIFSFHGAIYTPKHVVIDDSIITADGPMAATEFGHAIHNTIKQKYHKGK